MTIPPGGPPHASYERQKLKPLIVDLSHRYGGASTRAVTLATALRDWDVAIAALDDSPVADFATNNGIPVITVGESKWDPRIPFRIADQVRRAQYDVLDTQNIQSKVWGSMAAARTGVALVSTLNSWYAAEHGGSLKGKAYAALERLTGSKTDRYIAVSNGIRQALCAAGFRGETIDVIHNGIGAVPSLGNQRDSVRRTLGLSADAILCTAVGRLVWAKGYSDLIEALAVAAGKITNLYCVIIGEGELRPELQKRIAHNGLSRRCLLTGFRSKGDVLHILSNSDLFVMPSRSEGVPYALLEAGALGLPVIASRCGGIPEVVTDGVEALLVEPGDVPAIASGLENLCTDRERAKQLGQRLKARIEGDFSIEAQVAATKAAYLRAWRHRHASREESRRR